MNVQAKWPAVQPCSPCYAEAAPSTNLGVQPRPERRRRAALLFQPVDHEARLHGLLSSRLLLIAVYYNAHAPSSFATSRLRAVFERCPYRVSVTAVELWPICLDSHDSSTPFSSATRA